MMVHRVQPIADSVISFCLTKSYGGFKLDCEAEFKKGITAVFGQSGSGKTTLLNCLAGLIRPETGYIEIAGRPVFGLNCRPAHIPPERRRIGYVFQDGMLFPHMSVAKNIHYGYQTVRPELRTIDPNDVIDLLGISGLLERTVDGLSGGETQRVALARALASSPSLLLLDEPLSSLDAPMRGVIIRYLKQVWEELSIPMVLVSHSISEVLALAEDTLVLDEGKKLASGPPSHILSDPGVGALDDYSGLDNVVEAKVIRASDSAVPGLVKVGDAALEARSVYGRVGDSLVVCIRASDVIVATHRPTGLSARNVLQANLVKLDRAGNRNLAYFELGVELIVEVTNSAVEELGLQPGLEAYLVIKSNAVRVFNPK